MGLKKITYIGHSSFFIEYNDKVIAIDPWITGNPLCPTEYQKFNKLDYLLLSHGHGDHASDAVRLSKEYGCKIFCIFDLGQILISEGAPEANVIGMNKGGKTKIEDLTIALTNAFHSNSYTTTNGTNVYAGEACGLIIADNKRAIFHAGDTCLFSDLKLIGEKYKPDIAMLPIGDHFTMDAQDAALAANYLGVKTAIPMHYKTFPLLAQSAVEFTSELAKHNIECAELQPGETLDI